jgi:hypothetical protein
MKSRKLFAITILFAVAVVQAADTDTDKGPPTSPAAVSAKAKHDQATKKAETVYAKALLAADQTYADALAKAEDSALRNGLSGEDEAGRIKTERTNTLAEINKLKQDETPVPGQSKYTVYKVNDYMIWFFPNGQAVDPRGMQIVWLTAHGQIFLLYADGGTRKLTMSEDKKTLTGGRDVFILTDPNTVLPPPAVKEQ